MAKPRSRVADLSVYVFIRLTAAVLQILSLQQCYAIARGLGWLAYHLDKRHRLAAHDNLRHAFGDRLSEAERDAMVRRCYVHFCSLLMEILHLPRLVRVHNWKQYIGHRDLHKVADYMLTDRPLLIVTGHYGNWELAGQLMGLLGFRTHAIARPIDNPYLDAYLKRVRQATGQTILAKHGDFEVIQELLASDGKIATLGDQDAGQRGLFVDFFGRPASTHKAIAILALKYNVPMVVVGVPKLNGRYEVIVEDVIEPSEYEGKPDAVRAITQRFTTALENLVRLAPEQYFWLHRRWKHQPKAKPQKLAA